MKSYIADLLTLTRFILTLVLFGLAFSSTPLEAGFTVFVIAELTDAFDGTAAAKWPFPKTKTPKYRKFAPVYDMLTDALLAAVFGLFFVLRVDLVAGLVIGLSYTILAILIDFLVYGRLLGHPDTAKPGSLILKNFPLAKRIILARRRVYLFLLIFLATWTFYVSTAPLALKIALTLVAIVVGVALWFFLSQRRHHISRDAVELEKGLETAAKKTSNKKKVNLKR